MIRKRNQDIVIEEKILDDNIFNNIDNPVPITNWKEKTIQILNILEKEYGVDIYDPNNKPGMYLKQKKSKSILPTTFKRKFIENDNNINNDEIDELTSRKNNLFNHLKNKK